MMLALYKGTRPGLAGLFNRVVRWWDRGPYSHCELIFSDGISGSSSFIDKGVRLKKIEYSPVRWDFFEVNADEQASRQWFIDHTGAKYDVRGLFGFVFRRVSDDKQKYFCSECVMAAMGYFEPWRFGPCDLAGFFKRTTPPSDAMVY